MPTAYRIVKARRAPDAFTGDGSRISGGRWNSIGRRAVYTSEHASLAALETLVHADLAAILLSYVLIPVEFEDHLVDTVDIGSLPADWMNDGRRADLAAIGDAWLESAMLPVLKVPSAVIPIESNYVMNPLHPEFAALRIGSPIPFTFDQRLLKA